MREPEWTEQDRAEILALGLYRAGLCPLHGGPLSECTTPEESGAQFEADRSTCRARLALIEAQRAADDGKAPGPYAGARVWKLRKRG
ncbi:hypothetical protein O7598_30790 [Micromonospora sp. WMMC241]|uniref:hypothetical protein n=1 Tax=Micromonospora sp. WMMC241 TaxID=3015159 RepID=UPI0022B6B347|nr:hypothetical protein [Micromonospora sp. WMMC241]MCZ7440811.1 hypothetical protein [Micromonospora sp. WMMC241]